LSHDALQHAENVHNTVVNALCMLNSWRVSSWLYCTRLYSKLTNNLCFLQTLFTAARSWPTNCCMARTWSARPDILSVCVHKQQTPTLQQTPCSVLILQLLVSIQLGCLVIGWLTNITAS